MFDFFKGHLASKSPAVAVVECGGVGYSLRIPLSTFDALPASGPVRLWAHLESGGDAGIRLFGFASEREREIFRLLLQVSGVGPATALSIVSGARLDDLQRAVADGDVAALRRIKGIGPKTAQRLVLDLQETFKTLSTPSGAPRAAPADALLALVALGYARAGAEKAVREAEAGAKREMTAEELVREALKRL
jgi:Holliday junction DNA helicase RuvA